MEGIFMVLLHSFSTSKEKAILKLKQALEKTVCIHEHIYMYVCAYLTPIKLQSCWVEVTFLVVPEELTAYKVNRTHYKYNYIHTYIHTYMYIHVYVSAYACVCLCVSAYVCVCTCMFCAYMYVCVTVFVCVKCVHTVWLFAKIHHSCLHTMVAQSV